MTSGVSAENILKARLRLLEQVATGSLQDFLSAVLDEAEALTGSSVGCFYFVGADQRTVSLEAWSTSAAQTVHQENAAEMCCSADETEFWVDALRERRAVIHGDCASLEGRGGSSEGRVPIVRSLVVPIVRHESVVSLLRVGNKGSPYGQTDVELVEHLADLAWDIVERRRSEESLKRNELRYRLLAENSSDTVWTADLNWCFTYHSPAVMKMRGFTPEEANALSIEESTHPRSIEVVGAMIEEEEAKPPELRWNDRTCEIEVLCKDGSPLWVELTVRAVRDAHGVPIGFQGTTRDISARRRIEGEMRLASTIAANISEGIYLVDAKDLRIIWANRRMEEIFGYGPGEMNGRPVSIINADQGGDPKEVALSIAGALQKTGVYRGEVLNRRKDGSTFWSAVTISAFEHAEHGLVYMSLQRDISQQKRAEEEVFASRRKFQQLVEVTSDWIWEFDEKARFTYSSPRVFDLLGLTPEETIGKSLFELASEDDEARLRAAVEPALEGRIPFDSIEIPTFHRDGRTVILEVSGVPLIDDGRLLGYRGIARDATARIQAEQERRKLVTAVEHAAESIVLTDPSGAILYVNPEFERSTGYRAEEVLGKNPRLMKSGIHPPAFYEQLWKTITGGRVWTGQFLNKRKDGSLYKERAIISPVRDAAGALVGFVAMKHDITEMEAMRESLARARELERLGRLVGGVAHEVRNPLHAIQGATDALALELGPDPELLPLFEIVRGQVRRLSELMKDLLELGKPLTRTRFAEISLEALCEQTLALFRQSHPDVGVSMARIGPDEGDRALVHADWDKLQQVLLNLLENAANSSAVEDAIELVLHAGSSEHRLRVVDRGGGLDEKLVDRVFDPFFTTRSGGTGLGLTLARHIVHEHGGTVTLANNESAPGCTAEVVLPASCESE